ncbi:hypothetical protein SAMN05216404_11326 [Nitrosospira multiformis]|uniref:Uncharacterized protein n=1 Tax=Nitrosospira multiformis TaxID=1231 RepID=A0A1H8MLJ1_9PROT|nr:hypothetical protein SAMN05216404_11326 [Nitrosospira multiformis]
MAVTATLLSMQQLFSSDLQISLITLIEPYLVRLLKWLDSVNLLS